MKFALYKGVTSLLDRVTQKVALLELKSDQLKFEKYIITGQASEDL